MGLPALVVLIRPEELEGLVQLPIRLVLSARVAPLLQVDAKLPEVDAAVAVDVELDEHPLQVGLVGGQLQHGDHLVRVGVRARVRISILSRSVLLEASCSMVITW